MALVDVLIPTYRRPTGLAIVLACLVGQTFTDFDVIISDQTPEAETYLARQEIQTLIEVLRWHGHQVAAHRHFPRRGMAEQRQFLVEQSHAPYIHFIDDDVILDPQVMQRLITVIRAERCGFVGCAAPGLQFLADERPQQQHIELWNGPVVAEPFDTETIPWDRHLINNAANPLHLERKLIRGSEVLRYKVAWVGGANILFDREKLQRVGAFSWWQRLPPEHAGEEVVVQFLLLHEYGGCAILPAGTYHLCLPTAIEDRSRNAIELFDTLLKETK